MQSVGVLWAWMAFGIPSRWRCKAWFSGGGEIPFVEKQAEDKSSASEMGIHTTTTDTFILPELVLSKVGLPFTRLDAAMRWSLVTFFFSLRLCYTTGEYQGEMERRVKAVMLLYILRSETKVNEQSGDDGGQM